VDGAQRPVGGRAAAAHPRRSKLDTVADLTDDSEVAESWLGPGFLGCQGSWLRILRVGRGLSHRAGGQRPYDPRQDETIPDVDDTDADAAFDFPADLLRLQRELDGVRRELARWAQALSRLGGDDQRVIDMLWARQSRLSAAVAEHPFFAGRDTYGWAKAHLALQRASRAPVMRARPAVSPGSTTVPHPASSPGLERDYC
jgi:hypothetical protein